MDRQLRGLLVFLVLGSSLSVATSASATSLSLFAGGEQVGYYDEVALGCSSGDVVFQCSGGGLIAGDLRLDSWDLTFDSDPVVSGNTVVTNLSPSSSNQFTLLFTLPTGPIGPSTLIGGTVSGTVTDATGDDATVSTAAASALYMALIDGGSVQSLHANPSSFSAGGAFLSGNIPSVAFGTPIPSQPGPGVVSSIGIRLDFILTPGDSASLTSNFVVQPIPEPTTAALLGLGFTGLALLGRRQARGL